jgi:hypothetical protein
MVLAHPTMAEGLGELFAAVPVKTSGDDSAKG